MVAVSYREHVFVLRVVQKCLTRRPTALPAFKRCYDLVGASALWLSCTEHITWLCFWEGGGDEKVHTEKPALPLRSCFLKLLAHFMATETRVGNYPVKAAEVEAYVSDDASKDKSTTRAVMSLGVERGITVPHLCGGCSAGDEELLSNSGGERSTPCKIAKNSELLVLSCTGLVSEGC